MVWTLETRHRVGDVGCGGRVSDAEFALLSPMLPPAKPGGRPRTTELRSVLDGLFHVLRTGCQWRHLPAAYPPWQTVYGYWRAFITAGVWDEMLHVLRMAAREAEGREASPSAAIIDSQSVKTTERGAARLGRWQEGERPQAPHRGRYAGLPARRPGPPGRYSGPARRGLAAATAARGRLPLGHPLRRQRLCRPDGRNRVPSAWRLPAHHHRQRRRRARLSRAAKALGGRAHPRLALSKSPSLQGLRTSPRRQRSLCQTRDDPPHDRSIDMNHTSKTDSEEARSAVSKDAYFVMLHPFPTLREIF